MSVFGTEHQAKFAAMANNVDQVTNAIKLANSEQAKGSAQKEYLKRFGSIAGSGFR